MAGKTFHGTYVNGIVLTNPGEQNPATITALGYVTNNGSAHSGTAIYGTGPTAWTVQNLGRIVGNGSGLSNGIELAAGGAVANGASGSATGLIVADNIGIAIKGAAGTVVNFGAIIGVGAAARGIDLAAGGSVENGGTAGGGLIEGTVDGVRIGGGPGRVANHGTIVSLAGRGVYLGGGGSIGNFGTIQGGSFGILARGRATSIANFGMVVGSSTGGAGIYLTDGGLIGNDAGARIAARGNAVAVAGSSGSVVNYGTIVSTSKDTGAGIYLASGGLIGNGADGRIVAAGFHGVEVESGPGTVFNYGTIVGAVPGRGSAVLLGHGGEVNNLGEHALISGREIGIRVNDLRGTVKNFGTIKSTATVVTYGSQFGAAVLLTAGGTLANGEKPKNGVSRALISANEFGVYIGSASKPGTTGRVVNFGTIRSIGPGTIGSIAVVLPAGGTVVNHGLIAGATQSAVAIRGAPGAVTNSGTIISNSMGPLGAANGNGVDLEKGGTVINQEHGLIAAARNDAIFLRNAPGTVTNFGTIRGGQHEFSYAVYLSGGGTLTNGAGALVTGSRAGVELIGHTETVVNFGTIRSTSTDTVQRSAVLMVDAGFVENGAKGNARALITALGEGVYAGGLFGIHTEGAFSTLVNYGTIRSTGQDELGGDGVHFAAGGRITNRGLIESAAQSGIVVRYSRGTLTNLGSVVSNATGTSGVGVYLRDGGLVTNEATGRITAAANAGIFVKNKPATIVNFGNIAGGSDSAGAAVYLGAGGNVTNGASGKTLGLINGRRDGVVLANAAGTVVNFGTIKSASTVVVNGSVQGVGVLLAAGTLRNGAAGASKALISAYGVGVYAGGGSGAVAALVNYGTIQSIGAKVGPAFAVEIAARGTVTNRGLIESASASAVRFDDKPGLVTNFGSIVGTAGGTVGAGVYLASGGNVVNKAGGVIAGASDAGIVILAAAGTVANAGIVRSQSGDGVYLGGGGDIANQNGASISGGAYGVYLYNPNGTVTNRGTITGSAGLAASGTGRETVINFGTIASAAGAGGIAVELDSNVDGDVVVEPGAVFIGSILGGGHGEIAFDGGGAAPTAGVSGFSTVVLGDGVNHTLTLTAANFAGISPAAITVVDGNRGNTVIAATLPAADHIVVHAGAGAGADTVTGGAGDDRLFAGGKTVMTGGAGTNEFIFSAPGGNTVGDFAVSATNRLVFSSSGFGLGLAPAPTPQPLPPSLFAANATGSFTEKSQRFAYDTTDGKLFFSASGTSATEKLVVQLTGAPPLTSHLFYIA